jgi:hypothetical protein
MPITAPTTNKIINNLISKYSINTSGPPNPIAVNKIAANQIIATTIPRPIPNART